ncbi:MAG: PAS domain S-box protein [Gammaproteobacteria bacterium]|nr:PAS domain S-box protein [Gammaproteobacteria bacterium]
MLLSPTGNNYPLIQYFEPLNNPESVKQMLGFEFPQHGLNNNEQGLAGLLDKEPHWLKLSLINTGKENTNWYLEHSLADEQQVDVFQVLGKGHSYQVKANKFQPFAFGQRLNRKLVYEFNLPPGLEQVYIFRLLNISENKFDADLRTRADMFSELNTQMLWWGLLLGSLLVFLGYHAYLYYMIRRQHNRWMLLFVLSLVSMIFYYGALTLSSQGPGLLEDSDGRGSVYRLSVFIIVSCMLFHQYARSFIVISKNMWQLEKIHYVILFVGLLLLLLLMFNFPEASHWLVFYVLSVIIFALVRVLFFPAMSRSTSNLFTIGLVILLISVILNELSVFSWFPFAGMDEDILKFGVFMLVVFHSLAIADQSGYLKREAVNINQSLVQSDARYRAFITNSTQGIFRFELEKPMPISLSLEDQIDWILAYSIVAECNDRWANAYSYGSSRNVTGVRLGQLWQYNNNVTIRIITDFIKSDYRLLNYDGEEILSDGTHKWFHNSVSGEINNDHLVRIWGTQIDITERKKAEDAIREVAAGVSDLTGDAFFIQLMFNLFGIFSCRYTLIGLLDELTRSSITSLAFCVNGEKKDNITYQLLDAPCANVINNNTCIYPDHVQQLFPKDKMLVEMDAVSYIGTPLYDTRGDIIGLLVMLDDKPMINVDYMAEVLKIFSVRASAELDRLYATKIVRKLSLVVEQSPNAIVITDVDGNIEYINSAFSRIAGYEPEEILGRAHSSIKSDKIDNAIYTEIWKTVADGKRWAGEIYNVKKNGEYYWDSLIVSPITDETGRITHYLHIHSDITEQKEIQKLQNELQLQLVQAQKMEALGQLTGGVAHDFNNILTSIMGYTSLALDITKQQPGTRLTDYLETVFHSGERARDLVTQMLAFSRREETVEKKLIDLELLIAESIKMLIPMLTSSIDISYYVDGQVDKIEADPLKIHQLIMNLCVNARDAMNDQGKITLSLEHKFERAICASCHLPIEGEFFELGVMDTGSGISRDSLSRVFEPFFTTKDVGKGTGMGLAMVHGIMHEYNGHIIVDSKPGKGTEFRLLFPIPKNQLLTAGIDVDIIEDLNGHGQQIMVVDDEQAINSFLKELLETKGYRVKNYSNPLDALDEFRAHAEDFELVITDQTMPELSGLDFAEAILDIRANIPVILCTGYSQYISQATTDAVGINALLNKPFTTKKLLGTIRNCLK